MQVKYTNLKRLIKQEQKILVTQFDNKVQLKNLCILKRKLTDTTPVLKIKSF